MKYLKNAMNIFTQFTNCMNELYWMNIYQESTNAKHFTKISFDEFLKK